MRKALVLLILITLVDLAVGLGTYHLLPDTERLLGSSRIQRTSSKGTTFSSTIDPKSRDYVKLKDVPKALKRAVIYLEDARFYQHRGFDFVQIQDAIEDSWLRNKRLRGASTISQQLAKNLYLSSERSFSRKTIEALITVKLELNLPKDLILELYLNAIDWGQGLIGIKAASRHYFGKTPSELSIRESVFLASIIPNPARFGRSPEREFVRRQMLKALQLLYREGVISLDEFQMALFESVER